MSPFENAIEEAGRQLKFYGGIVDTGIWQGVDVSDKPEMKTYEVLNHTLKCPVPTEDLTKLAEDIQPNLPWADDHFDERVCGFPLNPGREWKNWPWGHNAEKFLDEHGKFNHNYMERYWPKYAGNGMVSDGLYYDNNLVMLTNAARFGNKGIKYPYGDLNDVINHLAKHPFSRQAYMPVFFPEDTGAVHGDRIPCSLGYHFIHRNGYLHCVYYLRSCDFYRHFRDDIYMTLRLQLWVLQQLRMKDSKTWKDVRPGFFTMHITSLHLFVNDYQLLFGEDNAKTKLPKGNDYQSNRLNTPEPS